MQPVSFAAIGECMIELSGRDGDHWKMGFAGDTFNTAFYVRAILPPEQRVAFITALGDDPFSHRMAAFMADAGVATDRIRIIAGKRPGLYAITLTDAERTFTYWRGQSAARSLADDPAWLDAGLSDAELLYFSGITLAILAPQAREGLLAALGKRRRAGARIAFDTNFRPGLWPDRDAARTAMQAAYKISDIVLPTFDDEAALFGDVSPEATTERIAQAGVSEIVVKNGANPCLVATLERREPIPATPPETVVDTTGAGDSFSGADLSGRLMGLDPAAAAGLGHAIAAQVVGAHGALAKVAIPAASRPSPQGEGE